MLYLTGPTLRALMRHSGCTIRVLAARMQIPMTCIRQRRATGLTCPYATRDWIEAVTGRDPGDIVAPVPRLSNVVNDRKRQKL